MGDLLRIDLTTRTTSEETIAPELIRDYIGGKGIGTHLLLEEVGPEVEALSPQNKLIFVTGPINGTKMFGGNRFGVHFLSPLTNGYGECTSGGNLAPQFARTGYKVVVVEGAADTPVFLEISEDGAVIHSADGIWGRDAYEAEDLMKERVGAAKGQACAIGVAGEKLVRFACVNHNKWHQLGRGGPGAVMGSKKIKGLVFHGEKPVEVARPDDYAALIKQLAAESKDNPGVAAYKAKGTVQMVRLLNGVNAFPTRYWRKGHLDDFEPLTAETMIEKYLVKNDVCPPCFMQCVKHCKVPEGEPLAGLELDGPEYETIYCFGGLCEIVDFAQVMRMNDICDRLGIDTMCGGNAAALGIEASRRGLIDEKLDFGDADGVAEFLEHMCRRDTPTGDLFAEGVAAVERAIPELKGIAVHVKGMAPAGYDPRSLKGMGLGYVTTSRGACHLRATFYKAELAGFIDPQIIEGKAEMFIDWEDRLCIMDTLIYCRFYRDMVQWPFITGVVNAAIGTDYTIEDVRVVANRIITESHRFNELRGFTPAEHEKLPPWITERATDDEKAYTVTEDEMDHMVSDYYELRGWGVPAL
jgi:aldehyde:ferredoxin oxidoreductase